MLRLRQLLDGGEDMADGDASLGGGTRIGTTAFGSTSLHWTGIAMIASAKFVEPDRTDSREESARGRCAGT